MQQKTPIETSKPIKLQIGLYLKPIENVKGCCLTKKSYCTLSHFCLNETIVMKTSTLIQVIKIPLKYRFAGLLFTHFYVKYAIHINKMETIGFDYLVYFVVLIDHAPNYIQ